MTKEDAEAALAAFADLLSGERDGYPIGPLDIDAEYNALANILTLARAGAAVMFPSEEFIDDVARRAAYTGPDAPVSVEVWRGSLYAMAREDRCSSVSQCLNAARAAIAAMKPMEVERA